MKKLLLNVMLFLCLIASHAFAQNRVITGKVTGQDDGAALPGVSVAVKGKQIGTQTSGTGIYSINVPSGSNVLVFSFVGYLPQTVTIGTSSVINVVLQPDSKQLTEVVVTSAYGIKQTARSASNSAQVVTATDLNTVRQPNINNALAGKVAGIQVRSQSPADLGRPTEVRLRGSSGFGSGSGAVYVVDGTVLPNSDDINLDDIETVTVLQGAAAASLLGSQGANGAIVITTKKAKKKDGLNIDLNLGVSFDNVYVLPNYQNTYGGGANPDLTQYVWKSGDPVEWQALSGKYYPDYSDDSSWGPKMVGQEYIPWYAWYGGTKYSYKTASFTPQPDNAKNFFNTGVTSNNSITLNKAGDDYNFKLGFGNVYTKGLVPNSDLEKNTLNLNYSYDLNKHFTFAANVNYVNQKVDGLVNDAYSNQTSGSFNQWFHRDLDMGIMKELRGLRTPSGVYASWNHSDPNTYDPSKPDAFYAGNYWYNFYTYQDLVTNVTNRDRLFGDVSLTYKLNSDFSLKATYRKQQVTTNNSTIFASELYTSQTQATGNEPRNKGYYAASNTYSNRENYEFLASYNKKIKDFAVNANLGSDKFSWTYNDDSANTNNGLTIPDLYTIGNSVDAATIGNTRTAEKYNAIFGRAAFSYKDFVFLDGSLRNDWFSTLPVAHNAVLSKSIGASFVFSDLLKSQRKWLSYAKLRGSWGEIPKALGTTNETFGAYRYPGAAYAVGAVKYNNNLLMSTPDQLVDPNIHGSVVTQKEIGLDLRFFDEQLGLSTTYWSGDEKGFPTTLNVNGASGFSSILTNFGLITKSGLEFAVQATPFKSKKFTWDIDLTYANLLKDYVNEISNQYNVSRITVAGGGNTFSALPVLVQQQGMAWGQLYGNGILRNSDGVPILDANGMYKNDPNVFFGSVQPKHTGGLQNTFSFLGDFALHVNIDYQVGGKFASLSDAFGSFSGITARTAAINDKGVPVRDPVVNGGGVHVTGVDATTGKPVSYYVDAYTYYQGIFNNKTLDEFIYDLTFVKLRELSLSYRIPVKQLGINRFIKNATFELTSHDLLLIYAKTKDFDPSQVSNVQGESGQLPGTRGFGFNLKIGL